MMIQLTNSAVSYPASSFLSRALDSTMIALALSFLILAGCAPRQDASVSTSVRDSAGITIVENSGEMPTDGGGWGLSPDPVLSVGTFQGDSLYALFQVQGAGRLEEGGIVLANAGSGEIRFYSAEGEFVTAMGRKGEGPGEFQSPVLVGVLTGDTLVVVDSQLRRLSLIHPGEGTVESVRISDDLGGGGFPQGMFADGSIVMGGGFYWSSDGGVQLSSGFSRRPTGYRSADRQGELVSDFGEFPGSEFYMQVQSQSGGAISMRARLIPFGKYAMQAVGPDFLYYGSGDSWEVKAFDPGGVLRRIYRMAVDPRPIQAADVESVIQEEIAETGDPARAPEIRAGFEEMPLPETMPAFAGLDVDAQGFLWVERYRGPGDEGPEYEILDPEGQWVGRISLPQEVEILEIGTDYLLVLQRDELEVEYVKLYQLFRPEASARG
jgi:hypothetical protein